ncbi:putative aspartyl protease family A01A [Carpediemonas membranifera]|uniref:Putative aspartyl protease family A01A n=1 Tax=Carpediemonas membranifera TaxID=201153 RepID=A0A8J6AVA1_9EUKA|nr:putative aspartyl protease family A01A [Carpediemonas membranifera]|eukprot:KAG9395671.1 putative aspartyl protease family A01A [Carpediemonas membranifera]
MPPKPKASAKDTQALSLDDDKDFSSDSDVSDAEVEQKRVYVEDIQEFCIPTGTYHQPSLYRLLIYAKYGPTRDGKLYGGRQGAHELSDFELNEMVNTERNDDICFVYTGSRKYITPELRRDILAEVPKDFLPITHPLRAQIAALFDSVPKDDDGGMTFAAVQAVVLDYHAEIIHECQLATVSRAPKIRANGITNDFDTTVVFQGAVDRTDRERRKAKMAADYGAV